MNKILPEMPILSGDVYAPVVPRWTTILLQCTFIGFAIALLKITAFFSNQTWLELPLFFKGLMLVLVPVFIFGGLHPKGWKNLSTNPFFMACSEGIYFPFVVGGRSYRKGVNLKSWLLVPWKNISNIRTEKHDIGGDGKSLCAVFDIKAADEELRDFFISHKWIDKITGHTSIVFYGNSPPSPSKVVDHLQVMLNQYKKSPLREKYERTE